MKEKGQKQKTAAPGGKKQDFDVAPSQSHTRGGKKH